MSGARRANWDAKLDAVVDAHRSQVAAMLDDEAEVRERRIRLATAGLFARIAKIEQRQRRMRWTVYGLIVFSALRTAWAVIYG